MGDFDAADFDAADFDCGEIVEGDGLVIEIPFTLITEIDIPFSI